MQVVCVTPQLLERVIDENGIERDNYVISTELPLARKNKQETGTDIFAVEMEKTDKDALSAICIEDCVNSEDSEFRTRLLDAISRMAITTNNTPEHNFLIGLAYLEGIDVEVDFEAAISIITESAEQGLAEAASKLADLFYTGQGCCINYKKSALWRKKSAEQLFTMYQSSNDKSVDNLLLSELWTLGECYFLAGEFESALETFDYTITLSQSLRSPLVQISSIMSTVKVYQAFRDFKKS